MKLFRKIDFSAFYANIIASAYLDGGAVPLIMNTAQEAVALAIKSVPRVEPLDCRVVRVRNTLAVTPRRGVGGAGRGVAARFPLRRSRRPGAVVVRRAGRIGRLARGGAARGGRRLVRRLRAASHASPLTPALSHQGRGEEEHPMEIVLNSKFFNALSLSELGDKARALGFDGIDVNVRPGHPVNPDNAETALPQAVRIWREQGLTCPLATTPISWIDPDSPDVEPLYAGCAVAGVPRVKLGFFAFKPGDGLLGLGGHRTTYLGTLREGRREARRSNRVPAPQRPGAGAPIAPA